MRKLDKATVFSIDEGNTFKYFSKKDFPDSKKVTCIIAIADMSKKLKVKRIYITKQIQLKRIGEEVFLVKSNGRLGNRITVEPCRRGYGYCRLLHAAHNSNKLIQQDITAYIEHTRYLEQQRKNRACNFIQNCTAKQLAQIEELISKLS